MLTAALTFLRGHWPLIAAAAAGAALATAPAYLVGMGAGVKHQKNAQAAKALDVVKTGSQALEAAAGERRIDDSTVAKIERNLIDAIEAVPDDKPAGPTLALACQQLREQRPGFSSPKCGGS